MRISRKESLNLLGYILKSLSEAREKLIIAEEMIDKQNAEFHIKQLEKLIEKLTIDEWDIKEEAKKGSIITILNNSNYEDVYHLILKHFIDDISAQEIWEDVYYTFTDIKDYDADDLANEIVNLDFDAFIVNQGNRFKKYYEEFNDEFVGEWELWKVIKI